MVFNIFNCCTSGCHGDGKAEYSMFRSELMEKCILYLETDVAYECLSALGEISTVQLLDMNIDVLVHNKKFTGEVRRCDEMERKLMLFQKMILEEKIELNNENINPLAPPINKMSEMETGFENMETRLVGVNTNLTSLRQNLASLVELKHVLTNLNLVFQENLPERNESPGQRDIGELGFTAGVLAREKRTSLERVLWFACQGNALTKFSDIDEEIDDPALEKKVLKSVVYIFYQGNQLRTRVEKIAEAFHVNTYSCPSSVSLANEQLQENEKKMIDIESVMNQTNTYKTHQLTEISKKLSQWIIQTRKMKAIFHCLNQMKDNLARNYLVGECWCADVDLEKTRNELNKATIKARSEPSAAILNVVAHGNEVPPTYNVTNKFTKVFQGIVDSYGIATYQEMNPAPFLIITFPFLFSLMFGDMGHGFLVFLVALWMVLGEKKYIGQKSDNEIWNIFFGGRYIILLMGLYSVYAGLIYNDLFSKPINIFGSAWYAHPDKYTINVLKSNKDQLLNPSNFSTHRDYRGYPFPFGMDPVWLMASNKITWLNSFKMKVSIIFGVSQMFFGIIISFFNHKFDKNLLNIFCEFLPEMIFLMCMFGYLVILIFYKWIWFDFSNSSCAPSLLINLISTFLYNYQNIPCAPTNFYPNQKEFQTALLVLVVLCIPWLLLPKPLILRKKYKNMIKNSKPSRMEMGNIDMNNNEENNPKLADSQHGEFNFGDIFIHQCIHTIEFCLGCISHTASYLRLWALSLAHSELSEVLWTMVLRNGFKLGAHSSSSPGLGCLILFILWTPWAVLTIAILLLMEGLSAFLHTLRLHWVEFQSKFYHGEGYKFTPFSFRKFLKHYDD